MRLRDVLAIHQGISHLWNLEALRKLAVLRKDYREGYSTIQESQSCTKTITPPPGRGDDTDVYSGVKRPRLDMFINDHPYISSPHSSVVLDPGRPFRGSMERFGPEYGDVVGNEGSWRRPSPTGAGILPSPAPSRMLPIRSNRGSWEGYDAAQLDREPKRTRRDGSVDAFPPMGVDDRIAGLDMTYRRRPGRGFPDTDFIWRGVIAKGGTPVCHARCVPIGKGIESEL